MTASVAALYRYPVKGLSPERLGRVAVTPGEGLPGDRALALALADTEFDAAAPRHLPKTRFLVLLRHERLAGLKTRLETDGGTRRLVIRNRDGQLLLDRPIDDAAGRRAIADFFAGCFPDYCAAGVPRLVEAPGHMFSDVPAKVVSLINPASVAALGAEVGAALDPLRFRGNVHLDGVAPWTEFGWIGAELTIGDVRLRVTQRIRRCAATDVDPDTGARDQKLSAALMARFGHGDLGVYAEVLSAGSLTEGDQVTLG